MKYLFGYMNPFMSPMSGKFVSISQIPSLGSQDYIIIGDRNGNAIVSPALIDVKLDIIELRNLLDRLRKLKFILQQSDTMAPYAQALNQLDTGFLYNNADGVLSIQVPGGGTVALPYGQVFVGDLEDLAQPTQLLHKQLLLGDNDNHAVPTTILYLDNMANLTNRRIWRGNLSNRPEESDDLTNLETEIFGPGGILDTLADLATLVNTINTALGALEATVAGIELGLATIGGFAAILLLQAQVLGLLGAVTALDIRLSNVEDRLDNLRLNNIPADGDVSFYDYKLINLADPDNDTDGVNLRTLNIAIENITHDIIPLLPVRSPCRVATTGPLNGTYNNGVGGVGATIENSAPPAPLEIEGIPLNNGDRLLVKDQIDPWKNGIYVVVDYGPFPTNWLIQRATDFDGSPEGLIFKGVTVDIVEGTINGQTSWMESGDGPFVIGTTPILFTGYPGQASITRVGTLTQGTWHADIHQMLYGGTGAALTPVAGAIPYSTASALALLAPTTSNKMFMSGNGTIPAWSIASYPVSTTVNQLLYSPTANNISGLATANNGVLVTNGSGVPSIGSALPSVVQGNITSVGTISSGTWNGNIVPMQFGGSSANLTPTNGAVPYSTSSSLALLAPGTTDAIFMSNGPAAPSWTNARYLRNTNINRILYSSANNVLGEISTANNATLMTNGSGVPSLQSTASNFVTSLTGTANQITVSGVTGNITLSLPSDVIITNSLQAGNLRLIGNLLQSANANGNILIIPNGAGITSFQKNVGFGTGTPHAQIQLGNAVTNRQIVLSEFSDNDYQFNGFGSISGGLGYNIVSTSNSHIFYAGVNSSSRNEVAEITGTGDYISPGTIYGRRASGAVSMTGNGTATVVAANTWTKVAGTTALVSGSNQFSQTANNRIAFNGTNALGGVSITASCSFSHNILLGALVSFSIYKNGVQLSTALGSVQAGFPNVFNATVLAFTSLNINDYIEVFCRSSAAGNIVVSDMMIMAIAA